MRLFREPAKNATFPDIERRILELWQKESAFERQEELRKDAPAFHFYDGPPFATGLPHYGHLLAGTLKDIVPRYWSMRGKSVDRRFGWDCHGLPVENEIQKSLKLGGSAEIKAFGIGNFNEACRGIVDRYTAEWERTVLRMGRWVHFQGGYRTMDPSFMESVWWVFKQCFDKGLIYEGYRVQPYSPKLSTPLSNFEVNQGYKDRQDPSLTVTFPLLDDPDGASLLVWTTTPWTLPSNLAVAVGPDIEYVKIRHEDKFWWIAHSRLSAYFDEKKVEILETKKGTELAGRRYQPIFGYTPKLSENQYTLLLADFVSVDDGAGAVHIAPSFGEEDFQLGQAEGLGHWDPLDADGKFTGLVPEWQGREAKDADKDIIAHLKKAGRVFKHETFVHSYPHCYRTGAPLLYRAMRTWFLGLDRPVTSAEGVTKTLKQWMIDSNQEITWVPEHIKNGRFGKWLDGARDWNLSRNRFWGTPIPVWKSEAGELLCVGSIEELARLSGRDPASITDLHTHFIDEIEIRTKDGVNFDPKGTLYRRTSEVLDCWFESGSMPYAQSHYPFENAEHFDERFPADFIAEGLDQTRGWFYTLTVLGAALFQKPAFKNVIVNGILLAEDGQKMSKSLRNYPDPNLILEEIGADALRMYLIDSAAVKGEELRFSESGVREVVRSVLLPLWNSVSLFTTYHNADSSKGQLSWTPGQDLSSITLTGMDRWILGELQALLEAVEREMSAFRLYNVVPEVVRFVDSLTNWYIRRSRRRFWKSQDDGDKTAAYATLYRVLTDFAKVLAPFLPFVSEEIWQMLVAEVDPSAPRSVHHCDMPRADESLKDPTAVSSMALARRIVELGHLQRQKEGVNLRKPLSELEIFVPTAAEKAEVEAVADLIRDELNIKTVHVTEKAELFAIKVKPNFVPLRKDFEKAALSEKIKQVNKLTPSEVEALVAGGEIDGLRREHLLIEEDSSHLGSLDTATKRSFLGKGLVLLTDFEMTPELRIEGLSRELQSRIQARRKELGLEVTDRVAVTVRSQSQDIAQVIEVHGAYLREEVQADALVFEPSSSTGDLVIETIPVEISLKKV